MERFVTRRTRTVLSIIVILLAGVVIALAATGHAGNGGTGPDKGACKSAMRRQFEDGIKHPDGPAGTRPAACRGVSDKDLQRFATEIMESYLDNSS